MTTDRAGPGSDGSAQAVAVQESALEAPGPVATPRGAQPAPRAEYDAVDRRRVPLAVAGARVMLEQLERLLKREAGVRRGDDPEDVHQMRVASRRLRAARRVFRKALEGPVDLERANEELRTLARGLGQVRDLDVFGAALRQRAEQADPADRPALERLAATFEEQRDAARAELLSLLDGGALTYLRTEFRAALEAVASGTPAEEPPATADGRGNGRATGQAVPARRMKRQRVGRTAPRLIARAMQRLRDHRHVLLAPTSSELHEIRIAAKRARYTGEFFAPAFGPSLSDAIKRLTAVQESLGAVHDADVAEETLLRALQEMAPDPQRAPDAGAVSRLIARHREEREAHLQTFREQWRALPRPKHLRRELRRLAS
jgi:CHAD domain-containing protein